MIKWFKRHFGVHALRGETKGARHNEFGMEIATLALLIEMSRADHVIHSSEEAELKGLAREYFDLEEPTLTDVLLAAERAADDAVSLFEFTREIDRAFCMEDKIRIVEMLWRMAAADKVIDKHEEHLVRKVAELLHVPHRYFIRMKHKVLGDDYGTRAGS